jgi:hypothetical protein
MALLCGWAAPPMDLFETVGSGHGVISKDRIWSDALSR